MIDGPRLEPASGRPARQLVVLVHGYGADGHDLIGLGEAWRTILPDAAFIAPHTPDPCPAAPGGRQWFPLSVRNPEEIRRGVAEAGPKFDAFLDRELAHYGLADKDLALVGFSQGTMLSLWVGPHRPGRIAGIVGYSGLIAWSLQREHNSAHKPPVLLVHGENDPVVPSIALPATRNALTGAGFQVESHMSPGLAHGIDADGIARGGRFLQDVLLPEEAAARRSAAH